MKERIVSILDEMERFHDEVLDIIGYGDYSNNSPIINRLGCEWEISSGFLHLHDDESQTHHSIAFKNMDDEPYIGEKDGLMFIMTHEFGATQIYILQIENKREYSII